MARRYQIVTVSTHVSKLSTFFREVTRFLNNSWDSASFSNTCVKYQLSMYQEIPKSGSGAPGPESTPRGTKSITFAEGFCQPFNLPKLCWNTFWNTSWNTSCNTICYTVFYNGISCYTERFPQLPPAGSPEHWNCYSIESCSFPLAFLELSFSFPLTFF